MKAAKERLAGAASKKKWLSFAAQLKADYLPEAFQKRLVVKLTQAGLAQSINVDSFIALKLVFALAGGALMLIVGFFKGMPVTTLPICYLTLFSFFGFLISGLISG